MSVSELCHGIYVEEWAIGRTEASVDDFAASLASARPDRPDHQQKHVVITFFFADKTSKDVRVFIRALRALRNAPRHASNWVFEGMIHRDDYELLARERDESCARKLYDIAFHEGRMTILDGSSAARLIVRYKL